MLESKALYQTVLTETMDWPENVNVKPVANNWTINIRYRDEPILSYPRLIRAKGSNGQELIYLEVSVKHLAAEPCDH